MVFCKTQFPIQLFPRHLFSKEFWLQYYVPTKTTTSNIDFLQEKLLQEYEFQDRKIPKQVETKTFCLQDKTFPWQSNFKSIFCQDMPWKNSVLKIYILQKGNLFWYFQCWNSYSWSTFSCKNLCWKLLPWLEHRIRVKPPKVFKFVLSFTWYCYIALCSLGKFVISKSTT